MKQILMALLAVVILMGCKKSAQPGTEITAKTILGKWTVSGINYQSYKDGKVDRVDALEAYAYDFEFKADGTVVYHERDITSTGQYTITYEAGKYYYWIGVQGRNGYPDEGKAEIRIIDKNSFSLRFETSAITGLLHAVNETMVRK